MKQSKRVLGGQLLNFRYSGCKIFIGQKRIVLWYIMGVHLGTLSLGISEEDLLGKICLKFRVSFDKSLFL